MDSQRRLAALGVVAALLAGLLSTFFAQVLYSSASGLPDPTDPKVTLQDVEASVARRLPLPEISEKELFASLAQGNVVLFDVREADEYAKSHLPGARRIDPGMSAEAFHDRFGAEIRGRQVIFYCAVGVRSGTMLARLQPTLAASQAKQAYNLRGGIFRWRAAERPLVVDEQSQPSTRAFVHHYDARWGMLLERTLKPSLPQSSLQRP